MIILTAGMSDRDNLLQLIGVSILFIFILAVTYYTTKFVGGVKLRISKNSNFKILETYKIASNKYLQLIQIGTRYFVISIGKDDVRILTELNENEVKRQEELKPQITNFTELFHLLIKKQKEKNKSDHENDPQ